MDQLLTDGKSTAQEQFLPMARPSKPTSTRQRDCLMVSRGFVAAHLLRSSISLTGYLVLAQGPVTAVKQQAIQLMCLPAFFTSKRRT